MNHNAKHLATGYFNYVSLLSLLRLCYFYTLFKKALNEQWNREFIYSNKSFFIINYYLCFFILKIYIILHFMIVNGSCPCLEVNDEITHWY